MPEFLPFRGIRYDLSKVGEASRVVAPPYDILSDEEVRELYRRSPYNIIRIDLGKLEEDGERLQGDWHGRAGERLRQWRARGILVDEPQPAYYALRQRYTLPGGERKELVGLIGCCRLSPFDHGEVLAHEHTFAKPKEDRLQLMRATAANISQIYAFYSDPEKRVSRILEPVLAGPPAVSVRDDEGQEHDLWVVTGREAIEEIRAVFADRPLFIADGHHRYETALAYKEEREEAEGTRPGGWTHVMMFAANLDEGGMTVLPTHRLIKAGQPPDPGALEEAVGAWYRVEARRMGRAEALAFARTHVDEASGRLGCYLGRDLWVWLTPKDREGLVAEIPGAMAPAVKALTVTALHELVLPRAFGIGKEAQAAGGAIDYLRDAGQGLEQVDQGAAALIYVPAPAPKHILDVALAGDVMPHKSTYFYPKLLTGLVLNDLERPAGI
ncbi:MAG: DUF1015 domain-containing protein [Limnochordia bacterium]